LALQAAREEVKKRCAFSLAGRVRPGQVRCAPRRRAWIPAVLHRQAILLAVVLAIGHGAITGADAQEVQRHLLPHPDDSRRQVEVYWRKPPGDGGLAFSFG
jgi:hypothetical protein